jgi:hypothetical protein
MAEIQIPLGIASLEIIAQSVDEQGNIMIDVQSTKQGNSVRKVWKTDKQATWIRGMFNHSPLVTFRSACLFENQSYTLSMHGL